MDGWWRVAPPIGIILIIMMAMANEGTREHGRSSVPDAATAHDAAPATPPSADVPSPIIYYNGDPSLPLPRRNPGRRRPRPAQGRPTQELPSQVSTPVDQGIYGTLRENPPIPLMP